MMLPCYKIFSLDKVNPSGGGERDWGNMVREGVEREGEKMGEEWGNKRTLEKMVINNMNNYYWSKCQNGLGQKLMDLRIQKF